MIYLDVLIIALSFLVVVIWARNFPYPSPLIKPFLPPIRRWPEALIRRWAIEGGFDKRYLRYFYRDPERQLPGDPGLVAPADGLVISLDVRDGLRYVVIALSFWDMHVQRCPLVM